jgi:hypothetical protein
MDVEAMDSRRLVVLATRMVPAPCVSIYLPLSGAPDGSEQARAMLASLERRATEDLRLLGASPDSVLGPLRRYTTEPRPWPRHARGLGIFAARGSLVAHTVAHHVPTLALVGPRFHVRPMLGLPQGDGRFFILALTLDDARLLEADRAHAVRVGLSGLHVGDDSSRPHQPPMSEAKTRAWMRDVARRVDGHVGSTGAPLLLACSQSLFPIYRDLSRYDHIVDRPLAGDFTNDTDDAVGRAAWPGVEALFGKDLADASRRFTVSEREGRSASGLRDVMSASRRGSVDTLYLRFGHAAWGHSDDEGSFRELDVQVPGAEDLFDRAAILVLQGGGRVLEFLNVQMPTADPIAAALRY